jgi:hypothetical protein
VSEATTTHFGGASSANAPVRYSIEQLRANLIYWTKHRGLRGRAAFYALSVIHHTMRLLATGLKLVARAGQNGASKYELKRSLHCLGWLLTGRQV